jgi:hypothetical protein
LLPGGSVVAMLFNGAARGEASSSGEFNRQRLNGAIAPLLMLKFKH